MKKLLIALGLFLYSYHSHAQTLEGMLADSVNYPFIHKIDLLRTKQKTPIRHDSMLVSYYTWKTLVKSDFSALTGLDNTATIGKFAALNINPNTSTFTFSPITITDEVVKKNFNFVQSFDFTGTVNSSSVLNLKKWKTVNFSYSLTWLFSKGYYFLPGNRGTKNHKPEDTEYKQLYDELEYKFLSTYYRRMHSKLDELNHPEYSDITDLKQAWLDSVARYEKLLVKNSWTGKHFGWMKMTATALAFDNTNHIITTDAATFTTPKSKVYYTPGLLVSGNYLWARKTGWNYYVSLFLQGVIKDSFTDVLSTSEWNKINPLTDSATVTMDTKSVYLLKDANIKTGLRANTGFEGIILFPASKYLGAGLDLSVSYNGLISNKVNTNTGWLQNLQAGLILSFKDKSGASTVNIEPYYQWKKYLKYTLDSEKVWGIKFSIPFSRVY